MLDEMVMRVRPSCQIEMLVVVLQIVVTTVDGLSLRPSVRVAEAATFKMLVTYVSRLAPMLIAIGAGAYGRLQRTMEVVGYESEGAIAGLPSFHARRSRREQVQRIITTSIKLENRTHLTISPRIR